MKEIDVRIVNYIVTAVMAIVLISAPAFGQNQSAEKKKAAPAEAKTDTKEDAKTTGRYLLQKKEQYQQKAEDKLHLFE